MIRVCDALGVEIVLDAPARRLVSLVPSVTETVFALGAGPRLVGCTTFCIHPAAGVARLARVGGTKDPDVVAIRNLDPDLVLANHEENRREDVSALASSLRVHVSYPRDLPSLFTCLGDLGALLGVEAAASALTSGIREAQAGAPPVLRPLRVLYVVWRRPWMAAARDTFIDAMLGACGFENAAATAAGAGRYPEVDFGAFRGALDAVLLSSEPFPFAERHRAEVAEGVGLDVSRVILVSGEAFSWFGSRTAGVFAEAARVHAAVGAA